jgi:hypothetical protein
VGNGSCKASTLVTMKSAESLNVRILMRGIDYYKEVRVVRISLDMYRNHGEYIWTWLGMVRSRGSKGMDRCPLTPTQSLGCRRLSPCNNSGVVVIRPYHDPGIGFGGWGIMSYPEGSPLLSSCLAGSEHCLPSYDYPLPIAVVCQGQCTDHWWGMRGGSWGGIWGDVMGGPHHPSSPHGHLTSHCVIRAPPTCGMGLWWQPFPHGWQTWPRQGHRLFGQLGFPLWVWDFVTTRLVVIVWGGFKTGLINEGIILEPGVWIVSGELPLTYLPLDSFSLSLFPLSIYYSLILPFYIFTGS